MNAADFRAQLERDLSWRQNEMRILRNQINHIKTEDDKRIYCKSLLVMLYSHFEGFCKESFLSYINVINNEGANLSEVNEYIAVASLEDVFLAVCDPNKHCDFFNIYEPNNYKKFFRYVHLVSRFDQLFELQVSIPDSLINAEANLRPKVIERILYRLGLPPNKFGRYEGDIHNLIERRNNIAHGIPIEGIDEELYNDFEGKIYNIMSELMIILTNSVNNKLYLKNISFNDISVSANE